ncbi:S1C family serine protease [Streptomyces johnsoniae]|uniref:Trypsin-like peptidase domain-containing protein n=1 Tax=Streptomyces johnsoniae TaxID=3075532 RepID=A0ABU2SBU8_9ACTN|nr:trypsin-like peptidase domain-containing protein [Streptomyces sp. DSM 41886]MDT0445879.1 trypsin-like peptidase domain-containing protein [Streptomyces sp. DSM 41886]
MSTENEGAGKPDEPAAGAPETRADQSSTPPRAASPVPPPAASPPPPPPAPDPAAPAAPPPPVPPAAHAQTHQQTQQYPQPPQPHQPQPYPAHGHVPAPAPAPPAAHPTSGAGVPYAADPAALPTADGSAPPPAGAWGAFPPPPPPKKRRNGLLTGVVVATLVAGGIGGGVGYVVADSGDDGGSSVIGRESDGDAVARPPESVAGIADEALPSVVTIEAGNGAEAAGGTGFVYDEEGHILTNNHVVASAADGGDLTATFSDGQTYEAEVVGRAEGYDVAVMRLTDLDGRDLEPLPIGNSDEVAVGDATIAIGAPFGLSGTVTTGIISAKDRPVASSDAQGSAASYMNALQTDASINPGNSGGPLLNADGAVIGINSAIRGSSNGMGEVGSIGLGFAIPINQAQRVAADLIETGEPVYPIIGAHVQPATGETEGAAIIEEGADVPEPISPDGPAAQAGLQPGDVITQFGDTLIDSSPTLISQIWTYEPGDSVEVTFVRDGQEQTTTVVLGERVGD